jgi:hypothetical protein
MKHTFFMLLFVLLSASTFAQNIHNDFAKLKWLAGTWKRVGMKSGKTGTETWAIVSPTKMTGKGVTLKGIDTAVVEKLSLIIKDNQIFYVADVKENPEPVYFKLTTVTDNSFVCENPEHDFPKKIAYNLAEGKIHATISGNGKSIDYYFTR